MCSQYQLSHDQLLEAQCHIWNQVYSFINSKSLKCAIQLGIPDIISDHGKPMTLSELTNALPINKQKSHNIPRLMRILIHSKLFVKKKISDKEGSSEEGYWLTPASRILSRNEPLSQAMFSLGYLDHHPGHCLAEWFKNDITTTYKTANGVELWETFRKEPTRNQLFNEMMNADSRLVASVVVNKCKHVFDGLKTMIDVGGGQGIFSQAIAEACPLLHCTVLDLPHVVAGMKGKENVNFVSGNMFESIPQADAVLLKCILHSWSDEECLELLRKCKKAIIPSKDNGGKVIIIEMILDDEEQEQEAVETKLCFDIHMMAICNGKERMEKEWAKLFMDAGFTSYEVTRQLGLRSLIEVFP